jgi:branched-chain amino acid transport system permease protein
MKQFRTLALIAVVLCLLVLPILSGDPTIESMAITVLLLTGAAVAWNIFSGYTGYISLGHATYYGLGAYVFALADQDWHISGAWGLFLLLLLAGLVAGAFAIPLGWIALRARRYTFIVITIAIFFIFQLLAYNLQGLTGGSEGIFLPLPEWSSVLPFYLAACTFLLLVTFLSRWIQHSKFGLELLAIRDDEDRARGLGVRTGQYKLGAYVLSAGLTGIVGALSIFFLGLINPAIAFDQSLNLTLAVVCFFGGIGTVIGPVVGGLLLVPIQTYLIQQFGVGANGLDQILFGGLLLAVILLLPEGILPSLRKQWRVWRTFLRSPMQAQAIQTRSPSFAAISIDSSELLDAVGVKETREQNLPEDQKVNKINRAIFPIPDRQSVMLHSPMTVSQKVKALHLIPLSPPESMTELEPAAFTPVISWRCPGCRKPFTLRGGICYCPRCGITRPLDQKKQSFPI